MFKFFHHLFQPHCSECELQKHYLTEKLSLLLEQERAEKFRLLSLLAPSIQSNSASQEAVDLSQLRRNPRSIMRDLERASQEESVRIRKRAEEDHINSIEKELGVN